MSSNGQKETDAKHGNIIKKTKWNFEEKSTWQGMKLGKKLMSKLWKKTDDEKLPWKTHDIKTLRRHKVQVEKNKIFWKVCKVCENAKRTLYNEEKDQKLLKPRKTQLRVEKTVASVKNRIRKRTRISLTFPKLTCLWPTRTHCQKCERGQSKQNIQCNGRKKTIINNGSTVKIFWINKNTQIGKIGKKNSGTMLKLNKNTISSPKKAGLAVTNTISNPWTYREKKLSQLKQVFRK